MKIMRRRLDYLWKKIRCMTAGKTYPRNCDAGQIYQDLMGSLFYWYSIQFIFHKSQLRIFFVQSINELMNELINY